MHPHIVDSHVHIWETDDILYPPSPVLASLPHPGPTAEVLLQEMTANGVTQAVLVQPSNYEFDNRYIARTLRRYPEHFAGVARIDVVDASAPQRLERWAEEHGLRGLRVAPFRILEGAWLTNPAFYALWQKAAALSLPVCFQISRGWLEALCRYLEPLIVRFPELCVVLDHMGHFEVEKGVADPGFQALLALARHERVFIKISGHYALSHDPYPYRDTWPFMQAIYEHFGPQRMMWGSDFPFILVYDGYARSLELIREQLPFLTDDAKGWILGGTAATLWPIPPSIKDQEG
jgi:predicted TIM-barrel fold metal-dependent hydrolase